MNGKKAKLLRRIAEHTTIGDSPQHTRHVYKILKRDYKNKKLVI